MKYREIKATLPKDISEEFNAFLDDLQTLGYYEILFDPTIPKKGDEIISDFTNIKIYLQEEKLEDELKIIVFLKIHAPDSSFTESRIIETNDYMTAYQEYYKPFAIGNFTVISVWDKGKEITDRQKHALYINPGLAFGTGHHETTKLMLDRMSVVVKPGMRILDAGTGSGILAVAAGILGAKEIVAFDIDPNATNSAEYNWSQNDVSESSALFLEGGFDLPEAVSQDFDLVLMNITYAVIHANIELIAAIRTNRILMSGIITERREEIISEMKEYGFDVEMTEEYNGWTIIDFIKKEKV